MMTVRKYSHGPGAIPICKPAIHPAVVDLKGKAYEYVSSAIFYPFSDATLLIYGTQTMRTNFLILLSFHYCKVSVTAACLKFCILRPAFFFRKICTE